MRKFKLEDKEQDITEATIETMHGTLTIKVDLWAGRPNYHCPFCRHATLGLNTLPQHVAKHHGETFHGPKFDEPETHD